MKSLIKDSGISEEDFRKFVEKKGHYKASEPLESYSDDIISRWVIPHWKRIVEEIKETDNGGDR